MYSVLNEAWKRELENAELEKLDPNFYSEVADYLRSIMEEGRMLDKRTVKARLLRSEMHKVKRMLRELVQTRYMKLVKRMAGGELVPSEFLTAEEERFRTDCSRVVLAYRNFAKSLLRGQLLRVDAVKERKTSALRFLKEFPEIIGADMKNYGPFRVEDVASLPIENAMILVKQGLAEEVDVGQVPLRRFAAKT